MLEYIVKISGPGMTAGAPVMSTGSGNELPGFIQELAASFRGWRGTRTWESLEHQLQAGAAWS